MLLQHGKASAGGKLLPQLLSLLTKQRTEQQSQKKKKNRTRTPVTKLFLLLAVTKDKKRHEIPGPSRLEKCRDTGIFFYISKKMDEGGFPH